MANASQENRLKLFDSMMLLSVLSTAADVRDRIERRRTGHDPTTQEDVSYVRAYLFEAIDELEEGFIRLIIQQVCEPEHDAVRQMDQSLLVYRLSRELHLVHQRLLSLYPRVPEEVVEDVRMLQHRCDRARDMSPETFVQDVPEIVDRGLHTVRRLKRVLQHS